MRNHTVTLRLTCAAILAAAVAASACNRGEEATPAPETQTQTARPANQPLTVTGCLKAGEAADTYVLTAARTAGSEEAANYQLIGARDAGLQDRIGQRMEVSGTVEAQQEIAARTKAEPAKEQAEGTSGTPTVQTRTEIEIRRLTVDSIRAVGGECEM
ncbi:MAG TPA: hypothetical protein VD833_23115 [Vicinamibacterales bacterium]|nr:hypothetical protein [Vicinamibacterales bacterium]